MGQIDLKHSLVELYTALAKAKNEKQKAEAALAIGSFYITNKAPRKAMIDSALHYVSAAQNFSEESNFQEGLEGAEELRARAFLRQDKPEVVKDMIKRASGKLFCDLNFLLGRYYLEKPGEDKEDMNDAETHFSAAIHYAEKYHMPNTALISRAFIYVLLVEKQQGSRNEWNSYCDKIIAECRRYGHTRVELQLMKMRAITDRYNFNDPAYLYKTLSRARAVKEYELEIYCLKEIADYHLRLGKLDTAENELKEVLKKYKTIGYQNLQFTYDLLAATALTKGNIETAMLYAVHTVETAEKTGTEFAITAFYNRLTQLCEGLGLKRQSLMWYRKWQAAAIRTSTSFPYTAYSAIANELISKGKARQVLKTLDSADRIFKYDANRLFLIPQLRARCYAALGKMDSAEIYNLSIVRNLENRGVKDYEYYQAYQNQAAFYISIKEFSKAAPYVEKAFEAEKGLIRSSDMALLYLCKFKVDSASGNYLAAIKDFASSRSISDSIYNRNRLRQTQQLQLQYATAERDRENLQLRNSNNLQQGALEKSALEKRLIGIVLVACLLILGLMVYLYQAKQRSNRKLQQQQQEINEQNLQLNQLLIDKEWLIKEIHHRVKNNLQIVSSLLNTQAVYLENSEAQAAIRDSQNRMQAISIVHQKLYQSNDLARVHFNLYVKELVQSICDSFQVDLGIMFSIDVIDVYLDTAQSVPIGLILNEAITNSIKYAFGNTLHPQISISLKARTADWYALEIRDNGEGLPADFDILNCISLGVNLMAGLAGQLAGEFKIYSSAGTVVEVNFPQFVARA
ncbi:sensor histidine kinase [Mucilaginibacter straminoryzae]|uniref:sensor histidine kinase n=1 Tax=Mucilaginibacter straminoryzae TaxID=2932774 RepID=UPI001FD682FC|nr:sensor histidine kinase [Mucilaginibacter straminoryzae]